MAESLWEGAGLQQGCQRLVRVGALGIGFPPLAKMSSPDIDNDHSSPQAGELGHGRRLPMLGVMGALPRAGAAGGPRSHTVSPTRQVARDISPRSAGESPRTAGPAHPPFLVRGPAASRARDDRPRGRTGRLSSARLRADDGTVRGYSLLSGGHRAALGE